MSVSAAPVTMEELLKLPDPRGGHYELHHGEVVFVPPPKRGHQRLQERIRELLKDATGDAAAVNVEYGFRPSPEFEYWTADVGLVDKNRELATGDDEYLAGAPNLVVEVLSPSNTVDEMNDRMATCLAGGCRSFWVVDPRRQRVSVTEGNLTTHYDADDQVRCCVFPRSIPVRAIFES